VAPVYYTLTTTKIGTGSGTITSTPSGITCGSICTYNYLSGTSVTLTASSSSGSVFAGWSSSSPGASPCSGTGTCTVTMSSARGIIASFTATPTAGAYSYNGYYLYLGELGETCTQTCFTHGSSAGSFTDPTCSVIKSLIQYRGLTPPDACNPSYGGAAPFCNTFGADSFASCFGTSDSSWTADSWTAYDWRRLCACNN